jgi:hypothetical protein
MTETSKYANRNIGGIYIFVETNSVTPRSIVKVGVFDS